MRRCPVPDSWGSALAEFNPYHEPAGATRGGRPVGGQFARRPEGGGPYTEPSRPVIHTDSGPATTRPMVRYLQGPTDEEINQVLGIRDIESVARGLVAEVTDESFEIRVTLRGNGREVLLTYDGDKGTHATRYLFRDHDGSLVAYHDTLVVDEDRSGEGVARAILRGSLKTYEQIGVKEIWTYADLDVGAYAWARYGFVPTDPPKLFRAVRSRLQALVNRVITPEEYTQIMADLRPTDPTFVWRLADTRLKVSQERLAEVEPWLQEPRYDEVRKRIDRDARQGVINIGLLALVGNPWHGRFQLGDSRQRQRLKAYIG